ncbi:zinc finger MYM-type protein 1-like [Acyrthosiphon pisum]|uniref:Uncharacterized protein n=1 Tax=Acyrthosiphon pisum TaxID=7029 RepID=A0A8R2FFC7_ACYPI|nr:zinc finger MYM-type protein 1-like [Acyrthosiphon pisum]|eukprot:XP_008190126.1 PREDICTED: zinc finger MYM-type protein 1-like [Acyrthosiphon pisum]
MVNACCLSIDYSSQDQHSAIDNVNLDPLDIGHFINKSPTISNENKYNLIKNPWIPSENFKFPLVVQGNKNRKFQRDWLNKFLWLSYSAKDCGAYFRLCVLFGRDVGGLGDQKLGVLTLQPLSKYKNAVADFKKHSTLNYHALAIVKSDHFCATYEGNDISVDVQLDSNLRKQIAINRKKILPIVKTILFCRKQNIALRGHRHETGNIFNQNSNLIENDGNFRALLRFRIESGDSDLSDHLQNSNKNATFISAVTQNDIIQSDETTDTSHVEQLSISIRFVDFDSKTIREDFIKFLKVVDLSGEALGKTISELLEQIGLSLTNLRGQGYDGAANMSGKFKGTQAYISKHQPLATYVHCLNLVLVKACPVQPVRNTIGIDEEVINFIRDSPKILEIFKSENKKHCPNLNSGILIKLCATRWVEHHEAFIRFNQMLPAIISFLEYMIESFDGQTLTKVNGLYNSILRFDFLLTLQIIINTMNITLPLSRKLQTPTFDISEAQTLIQSALTVLKNQRNENDFKDIFKKSEDLANRFNIEVKISRIANKQRNRLNISSESNTPENAALLYTTDLPGTFEELEGELKTWKAIWKEKPVDELPSTAMETIFLPLMNYYPNIKRLLILFATIPVTTCTSERSFSSLKRIKTYLRSTMGENRLNGLALLNIHPEIIIKPEEVVNTYANKHPRRKNIEGLVKDLLDSPYGSEKEESLNASNAEEDLLNTTYDVNVQESDTVEEESFVRKRKKTCKTTRLEQKCSTN